MATTGENGTEDHTEDTQQPDTGDIKMPYYRGIYGKTYAQAKYRYFNRKRYRYRNPYGSWYRYARRRYL